MASKRTVRPAELTKIIKDIIYAEVSELKDAVDGAMNDAADTALRELVRNSPVKSERYRRGWVKEGRGGNFIVRNKDAPQLTHILNDGTKDRQTKSGENRGRVKGDRHIDKAQKASERIIYDKVLKN